MGAIWSKERILGKFRSFRGGHGRGDVSLPQFIDGVVCMGSYRRGDPLWDIAHCKLQNTNGLRPVRSSREERRATARRGNTPASRNSSALRPKLKLFVAGFTKRFSRKLVQDPKVSIQSTWRY